MSSAVVTDGVVLEATDIHLSFGGIKALRGMQMALRAGEWCGLVGPNGSGKSSSLNVLSGFYRPQSGRVMYRGRDLVGTASSGRARDGIARTFQHPVLSSRLSLLDNVIVGVRPVRRRGSRAEATDRALQVLAEMECSELADQPADAVAYGIRKRTEIARALVGRPAVLLLDEPAAGLSLPERTAVVASLQMLRRSMPELAAIVVEHDVSFVSRLCETMVALDFGAVLACGSTPDVINDPHVRAVFLGEQADDE